MYYIYPYTSWLTQMFTYFVIPDVSERFPHLTANVVGQQIFEDVPKFARYSSPPVQWGTYEGVASPLTTVHVPGYDISGKDMQMSPVTSSPNDVSPAVMAGMYCVLSHISFDINENENICRYQICIYIIR